MTDDPHIRLRALLEASGLSETERETELLRLVSELRPADRLELLAGTEAEGGPAGPTTVPLDPSILRLDASSDAAAHFQRLTGRSLAPPDRVREPVVRLLSIRLVAAAVVLLMGSAVVGYLAEDPLARDAARALSERAATRGGSTTAGHVESWADRAGRAREHLLGIWPSYDQGALDRLDAEIVASLDSSGAALMILGQVRLMAGRPGRALSAFEASTALEATEWRRRLESGR